MLEIIIKCDRCYEDHTYRLPKADLLSGKTINFGCLKIKRLPRVTNFRIDTTKNLPSSHSEDIQNVVLRYGEMNTEEKLKRKKEINEVKLWLIYDFDKFFEEIIHSYIAGSFYPTATSCTTLAERLVNLFILKMRDHYGRGLLDKKLQKYVYTQDQNWQSFDWNMKVLNAWGLLTPEQKKLFKDLRDIRNRAVHYQPSFNPEVDSLNAVKTLHKLLDSYLSIFERKDILRVFEIPGEVWVKEEKLNDPFVQAFVLPCCNSFASCGALNKNNIYHENNAIIGAFSESEFIEQRKKYQEDLKSDRPDLNYEPPYQILRIEEQDYIFRII